MSVLTFIPIPPLLAVDDEQQPHTLSAQRISGEFEYFQVSGIRAHVPA